MRKAQLKLNRMRKYQMLVNNKQENQEEGNTLRYKLEGKIALEHMKEIEAKLDEMRSNSRTKERKDGEVGLRIHGDTKRKIYTNGPEDRKEMDHS
eukprot:2081554-Heterocapsa_arctica.AAC.1